MASEIRRAVGDGRLTPGSRLPASRVLAADLGVSRGVVTEAYRRLAEDGHLTGQGRGGTKVVAEPWPAHARRPPERAGAGGAGEAGGAGGAAGAAAAFTSPHRVDVFESFRALPSAIDLSPGVPDLGAFPRSAWARTERQVLARLPAAALGYSDPRGSPVLRAEIASWLARNRGVVVSPDEVVVLAGVSQGLALTMQVLKGSGRSSVGFEDPGSLGARQLLEHWGAVTRAVPVDASGLSVRLLRKSGAAAVLVTPAHQFPMGVVLDGERRRQLLSWAADGGLVIEDDYDAEHRYDRPPVPALRALAPSRVFYLGSVSKLLAPALRTGWMVSPPQFLEAIITAKRQSDLGNAILPQLVLARLMESGEMERHLRSLRARHRVRRDAMLAALSTHLPGAQAHGAAAGLHLTVTLDVAVDDALLAVATLAEGTKVQPLSWHRQAPGPPGLVLGYAANPPDTIREGVATVGRALRAVLGPR